jgi:hypothetical protein
VIPTIAPYWLPALLPAVRTKFPKLSLILREEQTHRLLAQLTAGQIELAMVAIPVPGDLTTAPIARESFVVAAPRGDKLVARRKVTERDLDHATMLLLEDGHCLRDQSLAVCDRGGAVESMEVRATSLPTLVQMVAGGLGVTLLPEAAAATLVPAKGPVALAEFAAPVPGRTIGLAWRTSSARLREFRLLAETMREEADRFLARLRRQTTAAVRCPICEVEWAQAVSQCPCGYAFTMPSLRKSIARLRGTRTSAITLQACGAITLASVLPWLTIVSGGSSWIIIATILIPMQVVGGLTMLARGSARLRTASRQLRAARQLAQLPVARVVE